MRKEVTILLVGVGGFGASYVKALFDGARGAASRPYRVVGAVEVDPAACESVRTYNVPVYSSVERFYASHKADLAVLSTPIYLHYEQTKICVENGSDVLCEKPLCTSVAEAFAMKRLSESSGRVISIGYQMSFSRVTRALKADIAAGLFGAPVLFKTFVFYPRTEAYYARNRWAGMKFAPDGRLVLDSPLHNAVAHHLNNMLFLLGKAPSAAAMPKTVQAELYRGYPNISNYDTAAFRAETEGGVPVLFYTSHCLLDPANIGPVNVYRFERATVYHEDANDHEAFTAVFDDGSTKRYTEYATADGMQKLWDCVDAVRSGTGLENADCGALVSGVTAAIPEVLCANGAQLSHPIGKIPERYITRKGEVGARATEILGIRELLIKCFDCGGLPSEVGAPWASPGRVVSAEEILALEHKPDWTGDAGKYIQ